METDDIDRILKRLPNYLGTFACNELPELKSAGGILVSNTDPAHKRGEHWIAIYFSADRRHGEYFDPLGRPPNAVFRRYIVNNCHHWTYNRRQLQSVASSYCGHYCVLYCILRCRGVDLIAFANMFTRDTGLNEAIVKGSFKRYQIFMNRSAL